MKTILTAKYQLMVSWIFLLMLSQAFAFKDIYEPNDSFEQAIDIFVGSNIRQQYTLHSQEDEDWFRFYASKDTESPYNIKVDNTGNNIDVAFELYDSDGITLIEEVNQTFEGEEEFLDWKNVPKDGFYYLKIYDSLEDKLDNCRSDIQYELEIRNDGLVVDESVFEIVITEALSGKTIQDAKVRLCGKEETMKKNKYSLVTTCPNSTFELTIMAGGYKTLRCHIPISANSEVAKNIALVPNGQSMEIQPIAINPNDKLVPSKTVYRHGESLHVEFPLFPLPNDVCVLYYLGIQYPDGKLFIIKDFNDFIELSASIPHWIGIGHENEKEDAQVVIDKLVDGSMPTGEYKLYLLRMSGYVVDPVNNLHLGELNMSGFEVK
jgi:hypothetical protein